MASTDSVIDEMAKAMWSTYLMDIAGLSKKAACERVADRRANDHSEWIRWTSMARAAVQAQEKARGKPLGHWFNFNLNNLVRVRLTEKGREHYRHILVEQDGYAEMAFSALPSPSAAAPLYSMAVQLELTDELRARMV